MSLSVRIDGEANSKKNKKQGLTLSMSPGIFTSQKQALYTSRATKPEVRGLTEPQKYTDLPHRENPQDVHTWIFQICKICAFSPKKHKKTYQKAQILHTWKIQVFGCLGRWMKTIHFLTSPQKAIGQKPLKNRDGICDLLVRLRCWEGKFVKRLNFFSAKWWCDFHGDDFHPMGSLFCP